MKIPARARPVLRCRRHRRRSAASSSSTSGWRRSSGPDRIRIGRRMFLPENPNDLLNDHAGDEVHHGRRRREGSADAAARRGLRSRGRVLLPVRAAAANAMVFVVADDRARPRRHRRTMRASRSPRSIPSCRSTASRRWPSAFDDGAHRPPRADVRRDGVRRRRAALCRRSASTACSPTASPSAGARSAFASRSAARDRGLRPRARRRREDSRDRPRARTGRRYFVGQAMEGQLFDVAPSGSMGHRGVVVTLSLIALVAVAMPARRASQVDPVVALNQ